MPPVPYAARLMSAQRQGATPTNSILFNNTDSVNITRASALAHTFGFGLPGFSICWYFQDSPYVGMSLVVAQTGVICTSLRRRSTNVELELELELAGLRLQAESAVRRKALALGVVVVEVGLWAALGVAVAPTDIAAMCTPTTIRSLLAAQFAASRNVPGSLESPRDTARLETERGGRIGGRWLQNAHSARWVLARARRVRVAHGRGASALELLREVAQERAGRASVTGGRGWVVWRYGRARGASALAPLRRVAENRASCARVVCGGGASALELLREVAQERAGCASLVRTGWVGCRRRWRERCEGIWCEREWYGWIEMFARPSGREQSIREWRATAASADCGRGL
ncbi:hypothetical protein FIBSPDRAFT_926094 [Athelia psychrophila]|uniref:Uncharacterized protein n=1 Tax=Athelia psychrophila TaxID=1759441 RepID=A0A166TTL7_9AGAM|nr:hypothetical protein FIBSPDRAFT_926094 [Fibularhizoctonia sp. CBS 109695]